MSKSAQRGVCYTYINFLKMTPRDAFTDEEFKETYNNTDSRNATCLYTHLFFTSALPEYLQAHFLEFKSERAPLMEMYKLVFAKMYNVIN